MDTALLQSLVAGAGSAGQLVGGWVIVLLYAVIGLLAAAGSILVFPRILHGRWELLFWAWFLVMIAGFYLSFAAYFGAPAQAWRAELVGVAVFLALCLGGLLSWPLVAAGYATHGLWDLAHCLSGASLAGLALTEIPLGYGVFCATYDVVVAAYLVTGATAWHEPGRLDLPFWRPRP
jgi:hypothetical protein